jgi:hypothetical protein
MSSALATDAAALSEWWAAHSPEAIGVRGLWFGLTDLVGIDGDVARTVYVAGTPTFDADDGGDWACEYVWWPDDRYVRLDGLAALDLGDWMAAVEHAVAVVAMAKPWEGGPPELEGVGVGFDDGDVDPHIAAALLGLGRGSIEHRRHVVVSRYDTRHVDIYRSARKHGVADADILHAVDHALGAAEQDDGKVLYLGADRAGNMLEVIAIERDDGTEIVIHAMRMRRLYEPLLREMRGTND